MSKARQDGGVLAEVTAQNHQPRAFGTFLKHGAQHRDGTILAAVVDENDFITSIQLIQCRIQAVEQCLQGQLFVVHRNNHAQIWRSEQCAAHFAVSSTSSNSVHTRSTSLFFIAGNSGNVTVSCPMRCAFGKSAPR